jgi:hypothetical protein
MWLPQAITDQVDEVAEFRYISAVDCERWNKRRAANELRLLTGFEWISRDRRKSRAGFKTLTVAYRDAYYSLIRDTAAPSMRSRLRLVRAA